MIGVRLTPEYEEKIVRLAEKEGMSVGPYVRRVLIRHCEDHQDDGDSDSLEAKLKTIERGVATILREILKNGESLKAFLDNAEVIGQ